MDPETEGRIGEWRRYVSGREAIAARDVDELESHLRDQIDGLESKGLAADEAFLVAIRRMGRLDELSREFAIEHSDRLWRQLVLDGGAARGERSSGLVLAVVLAVVAAAAIRLVSLLDSGSVPFASEVVARNIAVVVLPFLAVYFLVRRGAGLVTWLVVAASFGVAAVVMNAYPFREGGSTVVLAAVHVGVALWLVTGIAYTGGEWRSGRARMQFIRFTGEWFVYYVLIALGGAVLVGLTVGVFGAIGVDAGAFVSDWLVPCGAAGAVVVAAWLVEAKQNVIENIAPVLTRVFTPLFTILLIALIGIGVAQAVITRGGLVQTQRDVLIVFDVVLVVVLGLLLYSLSARDPDAPPSWFETLQLVMVIAALLVDILVLIAMIGRIGTYGTSANKLASLGLNLVVLVNLAVAAWRQLAFVRGRTPFQRLERWQTTYVPVYLIWSAVVVVVFPPVFSFA
jgi:hypothetical protein